jgi:DNA-binding beta-propeller fold protein YncE
VLRRPAIDSRSCAALAAISLALAAAAPAQADPTVYVPSAGGNVFQYGVNFVDGSLSPLSQPSVPAGLSPSSVTVSPNGRSVYVALRGAIAQYDVSSAGVLSPKSPDRAERLRRCEHGRRGR